MYDYLFESKSIAIINDVLVIKNSNMFQNMTLADRVDFTLTFQYLFESCYE